MENNQHEQAKQYVFCVWETPHYQHGSYNAPDETPMIDKVFSTLEKAEEYLDHAENSRYYLAHNEWARPDYKIRRHRPTTTAVRRFGTTFGDLLDHKIHPYYGDNYFDI